MFWVADTHEELSETYRFLRSLSLVIIYPTQLPGATDRYCKLNGMITVG